MNTRAGTSLHRAAVQHTCAHPQCFRPIPTSQLACRRHWHTLPVDLRMVVWRTWRARLKAPASTQAMKDHAESVAAAVAYWSEHRR